MPFFKYTDSIPDQRQTQKKLFNIFSKQLTLKTGKAY